MTSFEYWTVYVAIVAAFVSFSAAIASYRQAHSAQIQANLAEKQLEILERKIGMVTDPAKMTEVLPIWYVGRMGRDDWGFGLLLTSGVILAISRIRGISDDKEWMEVSLLEKEDRSPPQYHGQPVLYAPNRERLKSSVKISSVQAAFDLWSS